MFLPRVELVLRGFWWGEDEGLQLCCFHGTPPLSPTLLLLLSFLSDRQSRAIQTWTMGLPKPVTSISTWEHLSHWHSARESSLCFILIHSAAIQSAGAGPDPAEITVRNALQKGSPQKPRQRSDERVCEKGLAAGVTSRATYLSSTKLSEAARSHSAVYAAHRRWIKSEVESAVPFLSSFLHLIGKATTCWRPRSSFHEISST